jgi:hypothetical protein
MTDIAKIAAQKGWLLAIASAVALAGCSAEFSKPSIEETAIWTDPETGCNYIVYRQGFGHAAYGSLSIRFKADGTADCPGSDKQEQANGK